MVEIPFFFLEIVFSAIWLIIRIAIWINQKLNIAKMKPQYALLFGKKGRTPPLVLFHLL